jgi:hypothetical protein
LVQGKDPATALLAAEAPLPAKAPAPGDIATAIDEAIAATGDFSDSQRSEITTFAGYLGPTQTDPGDPTDKPWQLLYQDAKAMTWLLVPQDAIVLHQRAPDKRAAFQLRDVIWVKADAPVRQGDEAESQQGRFLVGAFTSAGDLHASLTAASTAPPGSGILCAPTPECCPLHRTH